MVEYGVKWKSSLRYPSIRRWQTTSSTSSLLKSPPLKESMTGQLNCRGLYIGPKAVPSPLEKMMFFLLWWHVEVGPHTPFLASLLQLLHLVFSFYWFIKNSFKNFYFYFYLNIFLLYNFNSPLSLFSCCPFFLCPLLIFSSPNNIGWSFGGEGGTVFPIYSTGILPCWIETGGNVLIPQFPHVVTHVFQRGKKDDTVVFHGGPLQVLKIEKQTVTDTLTDTIESQGTLTLGEKEIRKCLFSIIFYSHLPAGELGGWSAPTHERLHQLEPGEPHLAGLRLIQNLYRRLRVI